MSTPPSMTRQHVERAQQAWGAGIVRIAAAHKEGGDFEGAARKHIAMLYAYDLGPVLFKPTLAAEKQFRGTFDEALSYFVATNGACSEDAGFAIKGWTSVRFENVDILIHGASATAMGNYFFTDANGAETKVEYSFGYTLDADGNARINLHHSSMPFAG